MWHQFKSNDDTPKNRRLLLVTKPIGTPGAQEMAVHDVVVGHWDKSREDFFATYAEDRPPLRVLYWAEIPLLPPSLKMRHIAKP